MGLGPSLFPLPEKFQMDSQSDLQTVLCVDSLVALRLGRFFKKCLTPKSSKIFKKSTETVQGGIIESWRKSKPNSLLTVSFETLLQMSAVLSYLGCYALFFFIYRETKKGKEQWIFLTYYALYKCWKCLGFESVSRNYIMK